MYTFEKHVVRKRYWFAGRALRMVAASVSAAVVVAAFSTAAMAQGTLRVAITASDVPLPNGQTDQGAEGMRFLGYQVFEALVAYDLSSADCNA
jgi:peptide/nickel transport system substrate-binding protein